ncbi:MAG TPA: DUF4268 domain-containing protein [Fimbriimonadaceae bacterium]|nr:DUF4268 domain-containing protein [Fimbriimonadaceae bacterium]
MGSIENAQSAASIPNLGRLKRVDLRNVWQKEDRDFTPWLAQKVNLELLGEAIEIELDLETTEKDVGPFRADIFCKEVGTGHPVLIENQIERTDHSHLGQLLTYAAGLSAVTIVWIAQRFTDEHRAALDWLNEVTSEEVSFFGLEVELWQIGDSIPAPKFNVVSKPNAFTKRLVQERSGYSENELAYVPYWEGLKAHIEATAPHLKPLKVGPAAWLPCANIGKGIWLEAVASRYYKYIMCQLIIADDPDGARLRVLMENREKIDQAIPGLVWDEKPQNKRSVAYIRRNDTDLDNKDDRPNQWTWMRENLEKLHEQFAPLVKSL